MAYEYRRRDPGAAAPPAKLRPSRPGGAVVQLDGGTATVGGRFSDAEIRRRNDAQVDPEILAGSKKIRQDAEAERQARAAGEEAERQARGSTLAPLGADTANFVNKAKWGPGGRKIIGGLGEREARAINTMAVAEQLSGNNATAKALEGRVPDLLGGIDPSRYHGAAEGLAAQHAVNRGQAAQARGQVAGAIDRYGRYASGEDSIVAKQSAIERDRLARDSASQMASARGRYNPALARANMRSLTEAQGDLGARQALGQSIEQRQALQNYMSGAGQLRGQDLQQMGVEGLAARQVGAMHQAGDATAANLAGTYQANRQSEINNYLAASGQAPPQGSGGPGPWEIGLGIGGMALGALGGGYFAGPGAAAGSAVGREIDSDERGKTDVKKARVGELLKKLKPYKFKYRPETGHDPNEQHIGIMAQDLEKSEIGRGMVRHGPAGNKKVDITPERFSPLVLASLAHLDKRLAKMEGGKA